MSAWKQQHFGRRPSIARPKLPGLKKRIAPYPPSCYLAVHGPLHGKCLMLTDGNSAIINFKGERGRYECALVSRNRAAAHSADMCQKHGMKATTVMGNLGECKWRAMPAER